MQAELAIIENNPYLIQSNESGGGTADWVTRLFGCWHREMSRPFSRQGHAYRSCLRCGARRQFDLRRWEMQGKFYYRGPGSKYFRQLNGLTAR
jgi:hypothetical protein